MVTAGEFLTCSKSPHSAMESMYFKWGEWGEAGCLLQAAAGQREGGGAGGGRAAARHLALLGGAEL